MVVVDPSLDLTRIAPYGCGFQTGAGAVLNVLQPGPDDSLVVYGAGAVGLAAVAAAAGSGVGTIVAVDVLHGGSSWRARYGAVGINPRRLGDHVGRGRGQGRDRRGSRRARSTPPPCRPS